MVSLLPAAGRIPAKASRGCSRAPRRKDPMTLAEGRHAGLLVPLFSMPSRASWGIGEIGDIPVVRRRGCATAGQDLLQLLPIDEMAVGQRSPYSALTAMAIDPIFISVHEVEEFRALGGEEAMDRDWRQRLAERPPVAGDRLRARPAREGTRAPGRVRRVRPAACGARATRGAGASTRGPPPRRGGWTTTRCSARCTRASRIGPGPSWPVPLRDRRPDALAAARLELAGEVLLPEVAAVGRGHAVARGEGAGAAGQRCSATSPFMVDGDSADVWAARAGVPPRRVGRRAARRVQRDGAELGHAGLPVGRAWPRATSPGCASARAGRPRSSTATASTTWSASIAPTCSRTTGRRRRFTPADEAAQLALGEQVLSIFAQLGRRSSSPRTSARSPTSSASRSRASAFPASRCSAGSGTGTRPGQPYRDPSGYPATSVATSGTHDTDTVAAWWDGLDADGARRRCWRRRAWPGASSTSRTPTARSRRRCATLLLEVLFASGPDFLLLPIQDVFGWRDRINVPADLEPENWTWRLPWPVDALASEPEACERAAALRRWSERYRRGTGARQPRVPSPPPGAMVRNRPIRGMPFEHCWRWRGVHRRDCGHHDRRDGQRASHLPELGKDAEGVTDREVVRQLPRPRRSAPSVVALAGWCVGAVAGGFVAARDRERRAVRPRDRRWRHHRASPTSRTTR